jgi:PAS domain S-box-containing protein
MTEFVKRNSWLLFFVAILSLATTGAAWIAIEQVVTMNAWVEHTHSVISESDQALTCLLDCETAYRGYLITHEKEYLEPYEICYNHVSAHIEQIQRLTLGNQAQQALMPKLMRLAKDKIAFSQNVIAVRDSSNPETPARDLVALKPGKALMDEFREVIAQVRTNETTLLKKRQLAAARRLDYLYVTVAGMTVILLILLLYTALTAKDYVKRRRAEKQYLEKRIADKVQELELSQHSMRLLFDSMPQLGWTSRADGFREFYNKGWYDYTGTTEETMLGWGWQTVHDPDALPILMGKWREAIQTGNSFQMETKIRRNDGVFEWFLTRVNPIKDSAGKVLSWVGVNTNIQDQKNALSTLEKSERRFRQLADAIPNFVWITDVQSNCSYVNSRWCEYTGISKEDALGQTWRNVIHPDDLMNTVEEWERSLREQKRFEHEYRLRGADGNYRWFLTLGTPVFDENNLVFSWFGTCTDIHFKKQAREELESLVLERTELLKHALAEAEQANALKAQFISTLSHEVRTPMSGIIGLTECLTTMQLPPEIAEVAWHIFESAKKLLAILNDLLDFSKLQAGKFDLSSVEFEPRRLIENVQTVFQGDCARMGISLISRIDSNVPAKMHGDEQKIRRILMNLVSNAQKFTKTGSITIKANVESMAKNGARMRITVSDTGIGINQVSQPLLFRAFTQADGTMTRRFGGTGLGLFMSKSYVELLGGSIDFESSPGKGSTFWFTIPILDEDAQTCKASR